MFFFFRSMNTEHILT